MQQIVHQYKMKNKTIHKSAWLMFLIIGWMLMTGGVVSAISCKDVFYNTESNYQICGYCFEEDGSNCLMSRQCNFSIYYENGTNLIYKMNTTNNGDSSFTYNLSNISLGNYFGLMFCDNRSYSSFSFQILSPSSSGTSSGGGYSSHYIDCYYISDSQCLPQQFKDGCPEFYYIDKDNCLDNLNKNLYELNNTEPKIIKDLKITTDKVYSAISPNNHLYGKIFLGGIILITILWIIIRKSKKRIVKKE